MKVKRWHKLEDDNKISWDHEYMLPNETPEKPGKYRVLDFDLAPKRLIQLRQWLSENLFKAALAASEQEK